MRNEYSLFSIFHYQFSIDKDGGGMEVRPGYKQTDVGVIPEEWDVKVLSEFAELTSSKRIFESDYVSVGIPFFRGKEISKLVEGEAIDDPFFISEERFNAIKNRFGAPARGDILITAVGTLGNVYVVDTDEPFYFKDGNLIWLRNVHDVVPEFLGIQLRRTKTAILDGAIGSSQKALTIVVLRRLSVAIPPAHEQRAIATALSDVDTLHGGLERLVAKKRDLKQAAMQQLLTGQTRLPGFHGEWEVKRLGDVISHCFSGATPRRNRPEFYRGNIRWITSGELNYNVIVDTIEKISSQAVAETNLAVVPAGTFLMAITGLEAEGTRGACAIVGAPSTTNQSCMAVFPTAALLSKYLFHYYVFRGKALALQYCQGTKQQSYTASLVKQLPIALPPSPEEQHAIATVLSDMDAELSALEARRDKTRDLKQAMMQELLTGRIRLVNS
jgi:type I restriction enzyme S subunit